MQSFFDRHLQVELQALHRLLHHYGCADGEYLVVDVAVAFDEAQVAEVLYRAAHARAAVFVVLDEQLGGAVVDGRGAQYLKHGQSQCNQHGEQEPIPVVDKYNPIVNELEAIFFFLRSVVCHRLEG